MHLSTISIYSRYFLYSYSVNVSDSWDFRTPTNPYREFKLFLEFILFLSVGIGRLQPRMSTTKESRKFTYIRGLDQKIEKMFV